MMEIFAKQLTVFSRKLQIWSHLLKKPLMENLIFCVQCLYQKVSNQISASCSLKSFLQQDVKNVFAIALFIANLTTVHCYDIFSQKYQ